MFVYFVKQSSVINWVLNLIYNNKLIFIIILITLFYKVDRFVIVHYFSHCTKMSGLEKSE
jgi:hypothetical protein